MNTDVYNFKNEKVGQVELPENIFKATWKPALVEQVILAQLANKRRPWAHAKTRAEVSGGGKKPWRQKGTGRARHGSIRSPLWSGGGKAHGPSKDRDYTQKINKKMRRGALVSILSKKYKDSQIKFVDSLNLADAKTKSVAASLRGFLGLAKNSKKYDTLFVSSHTENKNLIRAVKNLGKTKVLNAESLNAYDLANYKTVCIEEKAVPVISQHYKI
jgi:large subunit ribosomal protein L4